MPSATEESIITKAPSLNVILLFAPTIFLSAFLLFCCEPMIGKMMLPFLGGASAVWITCLLFFQLMLLTGYGYAHVLERYANVRVQIGVHAAMMLLTLLFLPIHFAARPDEAASSHPTLWLLGVLIRSVGIPVLHCFHNGAASSKLVVQNADGIGKRSVLLVCRKQCRKFAGIARLSVAHRTTLGRAASEFVLVRRVYGFSASVIWRCDRSLETRLPESHRRRACKPDLRPIFRRYRQRGRSGFSGWRLLLYRRG